MSNLPKYSLYKSYEYCVFGPCDNLNLEGVETYGNSLQECLENIMVHVADWHGNEADVDFASLPTKLYDMVEADVIRMVTEQQRQDGEVASLADLALQLRNVSNDLLADDTLTLDIEDDNGRSECGDVCTKKEKK